MEENIKNRIILILSVLTIILFISTVSSCNNSLRQKTARDKEMSARLDSEEKANKVSQDQVKLSQKIKSLEKDLEEEKAAHELTNKSLAQEQMVSQSLKEEVVKVTKLKEALEADLKEALVTAKSVRPK